MSAKKISSTKDYRLFHRHEGENRTLNIKKHRKLMDSMKLYGFLESYPIVCFRDKDGKLIVKDGQHRLAIAETLGLPIHYVEEKVDFGRKQLVGLKTAAVMEMRSRNATTKAKAEKQAKQKAA